MRMIIVKTFSCAHPLLRKNFVFEQLIYQLWEASAFSGLSRFSNQFESNKQLHDTHAVSVGTLGTQ